RRLLHSCPTRRSSDLSATIDPESFAKHLDAPVVEVSGRTYPVEIRYRPPTGASARASGNEDDVDGIVAALRELDREPAGDVLVLDRKSTRLNSSHVKI